jgi:membrane fusion protein
VKIRLRHRSVPALAAEALPQRAAHGADVPSHRPLFRQEVLDFQRCNRQWGRVVPLQPMSIRLMVWAIIAATAVVIVFLLFAQYARRETVAGYLTPSSGTAKVFASRPGTVSAVHIEQGQKVDAGQRLLTVVTGDFAGTGEDVNATILKTLEQQRQSLSRQIAREVQRTASERERLTVQIQRLQTEGVFNDLLVAAQRERIRGLEQPAASGAKLISKGLVSDIDQKHREGAVLEQRQALISLDQKMAERKGSLTETRFTQAEKIQSLHNELSALERRIAEVNGRQADAQGRKVPLQPDMLLIAGIILETRTLAHWLLGPILSARLLG